MYGSSTLLHLQTTYCIATLSIRLHNPNALVDIDRREKIVHAPNGARVRTVPRLLLQSHLHTVCRQSSIMRINCMGGRNEVVAAVTNRA